MQESVELSFVIPVYNGAGTIGGVVDRIHQLYPDLSIEVVLVNDGSSDESERVCLELVEARPRTVAYVHLARNFGEHNAVMAGLNRARGAYVAVLDDDGQNPPGEVRKLYDEIVSRGLDVVYGRYRVKHHSWLRNLGSRFNDRVANWMLGKPAELYLSSFKIMNRFVVDEIVKYSGAFPYIDGLILRVTRRAGQVGVEHLAGPERGNYTLGKLFFLWLNMFLNFSIVPLRAAVALGVFMSVTSVVLLAATVIDKLYINPGVTVGIPTVLVIVLLLAGVQLVMLGTIGEYVGRMFLDHSKKPQFVVRYERGAGGRET